jgi:hypothetical protein
LDAEVAAPAPFTGVFIVFTANFFFIITKQKKKKTIGKFHRFIFVSPSKAEINAQLIKLKSNLKSRKHTFSADKLRSAPINTYKVNFPRISSKLKTKERKWKEYENTAD